MGLLDPSAEIPKQAGGMAYARFEGVATTPTMTCAVAYNRWMRSSKGWWGSKHQREGGHERKAQGGHALRVLNQAEVLYAVNSISRAFPGRTSTVHGPS